MSEVNITCYCINCIHNDNKNCELKSISLDYVREESIFGERWQAACESFKEREDAEE